MMKTELLKYQKMNSMSTGYANEKGRNFLKLLFSRNNLIFMPLAFLLGRASLPGSLMPFGISIYASMTGVNINRLMAAIFILLGTITSGAKQQFYIVITGMLLFNALNMPFKNKKSHQNIRNAVTASVSTLIPQLIIVYLNGFLVYDLLKALCNGFIVFLVVFIFSKAVPAIGDSNKKYMFSNEEMVGISILAVIAIAGLGDIILFGFNIKNILSILLILAFSFKCGPGVGSAIGVAAGLIVSMLNAFTPMIIGSYAFCGLLAGLMRSLGKLGTSLGFVVGNAILTLYLNGSSDVYIYLKEIIMAIIIFLLIPNKFINAVTNALNRNFDVTGEKMSYSMRIKELTVDKLNKFSRTFKELARTFSEISQTTVVTDKNDISSMFDRVADRVCKDCSLCLHCWDRNFYSTYQVMFKIVERLDAKGRIEENDIPDYFIERCERINDFVDAVNNIYEIFKVDMVWKNRIGESRSLVSQQLDGLSRVISNLASEIDVDVNFKSDIERAVMQMLSRAGIRVNEVLVYENNWGKYEISIFHKGCGGRRNCVSVIEKMVSEIVGRNMVKDGDECCQKAVDGLCTLKLLEEEPLSVTTGIAKLSKYEGMVSGDSYTFMNSGNGKYIIALSDGMGSGQKAATQSRATINLLEQFMESGFDKDTAIRIINSILALKSDDDSFATIDLSMIDLYDGDVEFVKIGAVPTFIKRENGVEVIKSASLPAGILSNIETELVHKKIQSGDFVIMMTDGILDTFKIQEDGDRALIEFIQDIDSMNPQKIADTILNRAYENSNGQPQDDMMVLAAKVWKKAGV